MLLLGTEKLPQGADRSYEIKLDGYRALAIKSGGKVQLRCNDNDFTERYSSIAAALRTVPDETVLDGELVALDEEGRPSFHLLQNYPSSKAANPRALAHHVMRGVVYCFFGRRPDETKRVQHR